MERFVLRAVEQEDGGYRVVPDPETTAVERDRHYSDDEVRSLAERLDAEVRWVGPGSDRGLGEGVVGGAPRTESANIDPWGGPLPPPPE